MTTLATDITTLLDHATHTLNRLMSSPHPPTEEQRTLVLRQLVATSEAAARLAETERLKAVALVARSEKLKTDAEAEKLNAETARMNAETERVRVEAEVQAGVVAGENVKMDMQTERIKAETERMNAETERGRVEAETESLRLLAEAEGERHGREAVRAVAEAEKMTAEAMVARSEAMRIDAETNRLNAETERLKAEARRLEVEAEVVAENARNARKGVERAMIVQSEQTENDSEKERVKAEAETEIDNIGNEAERAMAETEQLNEETEQKPVEAETSGENDVAESARETGRGPSGTMWQRMKESLELRNERVRERALTEEEAQKVTKKADGAVAEPETDPEQKQPEAETPGANDPFRLAEVSQPISFWDSLQAERDGVMAETESMYAEPGAAVKEGDRRKVLEVEQAVGEWRKLENRRSEMLKKWLQE